MTIHRTAPLYHSPLTTHPASPFVIRRNPNVNPQRLAGLNLNALSRPQFSSGMHHLQVVFARWHIGQAKLAIGRSHLIPRMIEDKYPGAHRAMEYAANMHWLPNAAGFVESNGVVAAARHIHVERSDFTAGLHIVRGLVGIGEFHRIAAANDDCFRRELKILLVD